MIRDTGTQKYSFTGIQGHSDKGHRDTDTVIQGTVIQGHRDTGIQ